jgi:hypothetical protein
MELSCLANSDGVNLVSLLVCSFHSHNSGLHYDVTYELDRGRITIADTEALLESFALETGEDQSGNNQNINDTKDAQKLTMAEIEAMKEAESNSSDIIRAIVRNCKHLLLTGLSYHI